VFGDGYLYSHSHVFKSIRDQALKSSVTFGAEPELQSQYDAFPLLCLNEIIKHRCVPAKDNVSPLRRFERDYHLDLKFYPKPVNPITHETVHILVNDFFGGQPLHFTEGPVDKYYVGQLIAGESAANTFEHWIAHNCHDEILGSLCRFNLYRTPSTEHTTQYSYLKNKIGEKSVFKLLFYSFVVANFYHKETKPSASLVDALISFCQLNKKNPLELELSKSVIADGYQLSRSFATQTTQGFFKFIGGPSTLEEAYFFSIEDLIFQDQFFEPLIDHLFSVVIAPSKKESKTILPTSLQELPIDAF